MDSHIKQPGGRDQILPRENELPIGGFDPVDDPQKLRTQILAGDAGGIFSQPQLCKRDIAAKSPKQRLRDAQRDRGAPGGIRVVGDGGRIGDVVVPDTGRELNRTTGSELTPKAGVHRPLLGVLDQGRQRNTVQLGDDTRLLQTGEVEVREEHRIERRLGLNDLGGTDALREASALGGEVVLNRRTDRGLETDEDLLLLGTVEVFAQIDRQAPSSGRRAKSVEFRSSRRQCLLDFRRGLGNCFKLGIRLYLADLVGNGGFPGDSPPFIGVIIAIGTTAADGRDRGDGEKKADDSGGKPAHMAES